MTRVTLSNIDADPYYRMIGNRPEILAAWGGLDKAMLGPSSKVSVDIKEEARRALAQNVGCAFCATVGGKPSESHMDPKIVWPLLWRTRSRPTTPKSIIRPSKRCVHSSPTKRSSNCWRGSASNMAPTSSARWSSSTQRRPRRWSATTNSSIAKPRKVFVRGQRQIFLRKQSSKLVDDCSPRPANGSLGRISMPFALRLRLSSRCRR